MELVIDQVQKVDGRDDTGLAEDSRLGIWLEGFGTACNRGIQGCRALSAETRNILGKPRELAPQQESFGNGHR